MGLEMAVDELLWVLGDGSFRDLGGMAKWVIV